VQAQLVSEREKLNDISLNASLDVGALPANGTYRYRIVLRPAELTLPRWVSEWDMPESSLESWRKHPADFDGRRTFNLGNFLGTLQAAVQQGSAPQVAEIDCYFQVGT